MKPRCLLFVLLFLFLFVEPTRSACTSEAPLQVLNARLLTDEEKARYSLSVSDPCAIACLTGYSGPFCAPNPAFTSLPTAPWNAIGSYLAQPSSVFRTMTLDVSPVSSLQFSSKDYTAVGISSASPHPTSVLVEVSIVTWQTTLLLSPWPTGVPSSQQAHYRTTDAVRVANGQIFVCRTDLTGPSGVYHDIAVYTGGNAASRIMVTSEKAALLEVFQDKGMNTSFLYTVSQNIVRCTPSLQTAQCTTLITGASIPQPVTGLACGVDCPEYLYASAGTGVYRISQGAAGLLHSDAQSIKCLTSAPLLNTVVYRAGASIGQVSFSLGGTTKAASVAYTTPTTVPAVCSIDLAESHTQILLVENGRISTLSSLQTACPLQTTSEPITATSETHCVACPSVPANAHPVVGSPACEWACNEGAALIGSQCVTPTLQPCPEFYAPNSGLLYDCSPAALPWAPAGKYLSGVTVSAESQFTYALSSLGLSTLQPYYLTAGRGVLFLSSVSGYIFRAFDQYLTWARLAFGGTQASNPSECIRYTQNNRFYLLHHDGNRLFAAFQPSTANLHCLWAFARTPSGSDLYVTIEQYWTLGGKLCSMTTDGEDSVFLLFCGVHYFLKTKVSNKAFTYLAGGVSPGYVNGALSTARFNSPSSIVFYGSAGGSPSLSSLFVTDTENCLLREIDMHRSRVHTVSGVKGICERRDASVARPQKLITTGYAGFFLLLDQLPGDAYPWIRQYHAPSGRLLTIREIEHFSDVSAFFFHMEGVFLASQNLYYSINPVATACGETRWSRTGSAKSADSCYSCETGYFSNGVGCVACSTGDCNYNGYMTIECSGGRDMMCVPCTNGPSGTSYYEFTGPATAIGSGSDCPWRYTPPCPIGYYKHAKENFCVSCPDWSTTPGTGKLRIDQCVCLNNGGSPSVSNPTCTIPSPFKAPPAVCPPFTSCAAETVPAFPFPINRFCSSANVDNPGSVCACDSGEFIQQIFPKNCSVCPSGLYSPNGTHCVNCPPYAEPSLDGSACRCSGGTTDVGLTGVELLCVCSEGKGFDGAACSLCQVNQYNAVDFVLSTTPWAQADPCEPCLAGTWSAPGAGYCTACPFGQFRSPEMETCQPCSSGYYATDAATGQSCEPCADACHGLSEAACPTDGTKLVCSECPPVRENAVFSGGDNCASDCLPGFYERDGECTECGLFNSTSCPAGSIVVACGLYYDASCVTCENETKPVYFSQWRATVDGPSTTCEWECAEGYTAKPQTWIYAGSTVWECVKDGSRAGWDIFTV